MNGQRKLFIKEYQRGDKTLTDICETFDIGRPTGYKWVKRHMFEGEEGLEDRNRARHTQADKTDKRLEEKILEVKHKYSAWGPKKIYAYLKRHNPDEKWPSATTFGNILNRHGLVSFRKNRCVVA